MRTFMGTQARAETHPACQLQIKLERKCSIIKYHVEEREETDLNASDDFI